MLLQKIITGFVIIELFVSCSSVSDAKKADTDSVIACETNLPSRFKSSLDTPSIVQGENSLEGMIKIPGGEFMMGASDNEGRPDEYPQHKVKVDAFWMDATEVTNARFKKFTDATGYITTAERKPDWEELKKQ